MNASTNSIDNIRIDTQISDDNEDVLLLNATITRHLNLKEHLHLESQKANGKSDNRIGPVSSGDVSDNTTALALYELLKQYVDLLESPAHGGWSLQEDNTVRQATSA